MNKQGFTLIELIVAFSIMAIISLVGIAAFLSYNRAQMLTTATSDMAGIFNLAKARSSSQVKLASCTGSLDGYKVGLCKLSPTDCLPPESDKDYSVYAVCSGTTVSPAIVSKKLPGNISLASGGPTVFLFRVLTGGVDFSGGNPGNITINGFSGSQKIIQVFSNGRIVAN